MYYIVTTHASLCWDPSLSQSKDTHLFSPVKLYKQVTFRFVSQETLFDWPGSR